MNRGSAAIPADVEVYSFTWGWRFLAHVGLVFFSGGAILAVSLPDQTGGLQIFAALIFVAFAFLSWQLRQTYRRSIGVGGGGLWQFGPGERPRFIAWEDIDEVTERSVMQRLVVADRRGGKINLEYQLQGFERLRGIVLENTKSNRERKFQNRTEFRKDRSVIDLIAVISALFFGALAVVSLRDNEILKACFFMIFAVAMPLVAIISMATRLNLTDAGVVVSYLLKQEFIPFSDITDIQLRNERDGHGNSLAFVHLFRSGAKPVKLGGFKGGSIPLYETLLRHWRNSRGAPAA